MAVRPRLNWLPCVLAPLFLVFSLLVAGAGADDDYLKIFNGIQDADSIAKSGKTEQALAKYRELYTALQNFRKEHPEWDPQVLGFRTSYVRQKVLTLTEQITQAQMAAAQANASSQGQAKEGGAAATLIKVLEAGAEPLAALRLHPAAGDKQSLQLRILMAMEVKMGEMQAPSQKMPELIIGMDTTTTAVADNGDIDFTFAFSSLEVGDNRGMPAQALDAVKTSLERLKGLSGKGTVSSQGEPKQMSYNRPAGAGDPMLQNMTQAEDFFSTTGVIFPEEPVGKGARWEVSRPVKSQGMTLQQVTTCELTEIDGETVTIKSSFKQSASNQKLPTPAQPGMSMTLEKMTGTGTGSSTFELSRLMAAKATARVHSDLLTSMAMQGQKQQVTMKMDITVNLETK